MLSLLRMTSYGSLLADREVPYNITVRALNLAGCGEVQQIYCFTQEGGKLYNYASYFQDS